MGMSVKALQELLENDGIDKTATPHILRYWIAEKIEDPTDEDMLEQLYRSSTSPAAVQEELSRLERDPDLLASGALAVLAEGWQDASEEERIRRNIEDAQAQLPVLETAILAIVVMYGLYLVTTGGVKAEKKTLSWDADGSIKEETATEYFGPTGPLGQITRLFLKGGPGDS
jgi:hypothetical protein